MEDGVLDHLVKPRWLFPDNVSKHINCNVAARTTPQAFCQSVTEQLIVWLLDCDEKFEALQRASRCVMVVEARDQPGVSCLTQIFIEESLNLRNHLNDLCCNNVQDSTKGSRFTS